VNPVMFSQCISAIGVMGIVIVGLLVIVQAISLENAARGVGRTFSLLILTLAMLCLVKTLIVPVVVAALVALQHFMARIVGIVLIVFVGILAIRWLVFRLNKGSQERGDHETGEL